MAPREAVLSVLHSGSFFDGGQENAKPARLLRARRKRSCESGHGPNPAMISCRLMSTSRGPACQLFGTGARPIRQNDRMNMS